jgi:hypothetical protein
VTAHDLARRCWIQLAREVVPHPGWTALAAPAPYLLANAAWSVAPEAVGNVAPWFRVRSLPPAVIAPTGDAALQAALRDHGYTPEERFALRPAAARVPDPEVLVEQVGWAQMRHAAEVLARRYGEPGAAPLLASSLRDALATHPALLGFLAYRLGQPTGALVACEEAGALVGLLLAEAKGALEHRLGLEAAATGRRALVLEALPEGRGAAALTRWALP